MKFVKIILGLTIVLLSQSPAQKGGNAILMDGVDDFIRVSHHSILNPGTGSWTISLWIKPPNEMQRAPILVKRNPTEGYNQYSLGIADTEAHNPTPGKRIYSNYIDSSGISERSGYMTDEFVDGNWHHIAFVADKDSDSIFTYIDGIKLHYIIQYNYGDWPDVENLEDLFIGHNDYIHFFKGEMDELSIWNKALSAEQVYVVMNDTLSPSYYLSVDSSLVGYWRFDEFENLGIGTAGIDDIRDLSCWRNHGDAEGNPFLVPSGILLDMHDCPTIFTYFRLTQNYPNPFNPSTIIKYALSRGQFVTLKIYDLLGKEIKTLVNEAQVNGIYQAVWIGNNNSGKKVSSGIYFYQLRSGDFVETKKMLLIK